MCPPGVTVRISNYLEIIVKYRGRHSAESASRKKLMGAYFCNKLDAVSSEIYCNLETLRPLK